MVKLDSIGNTGASGASLAAPVCPDPSDSCAAGWFLTYSFLGLCRHKDLEKCAVNRTRWKLFPQRWGDLWVRSRHRRFVRAPFVQTVVERLEGRAVLSAVSASGEFLIAVDSLATSEEVESAIAAPPQNVALSEAELQSVLALGASQADQVESLRESPVRREVVFVDEAVPESEALFHELAARNDRTLAVTVFRIDSGSDGVEQISRLLRSAQPWDAVHIISHGSGTGL